MIVYLINNALLIIESLNCLLGQLLVHPVQRKICMLFCLFLCEQCVISSSAVIAVSHMYSEPDIITPTSAVPWTMQYGNRNPGMAFFRTWNSWVPFQEYSERIVPHEALSYIQHPSIVRVKRVKQKKKANVEPQLFASRHCLLLLTQRIWRTPTYWFGLIRTVIKTSFCAGNCLRI